MILPPILGPQKADFGGSERFAALCFSIGNKGYIGMGLGTGYVGVNDFWNTTLQAIYGQRKLILIG